jgi:hypothetical protein
LGLSNVQYQEVDTAISQIFKNPKLDPSYNLKVSLSLHATQQLARRLLQPIIVTLIEDYNWENIPREWVDSTI